MTAKSRGAFMRWWWARFESTAVRGSGCYGARRAGLQLGFVFIERGGQMEFDFERMPSSPLLL